MTSIEMIAAYKQDVDDYDDEEEEQASLLTAESNGHKNQGKRKVGISRDNVSVSFVWKYFAIIFLVAFLALFAKHVGIDTSFSRESKSHGDIEGTLNTNLTVASDANNKDKKIITFEKGFRKPENQLSTSYIPRGRSMTKDEKKQLEEKWGSWKLKAPQVVEDLPVTEYPNGDIPRESFPKNSWQIDPNFLKKWLPEGIALTERAMEAILAEYGNGKDDKPNKTFEERSYMFSVDILESRSSNGKPPYNLKKPPGNAGYATNSTLNAIKRRLLHAIMLEDTFTIVMGGHSAAAGHGNMFQQSYTMQVQRILEPILARLGVYHQAHNFGYGGLGTSQNSLGAGDLYGKNIDILIWDSGMTEPDPPSKDVFIRQAILSADKYPVIWGDPNPLYQAIVPELGSIYTGFGGACLSGIPSTQNADQVKSIPWAARYIKCDNEATQICKSSRYSSLCWIERDDVQPKGQKSVPGGQASWHPGNRFHQLAGRAIAFVILQQLHAGLEDWSKAENYALPDEAWHLSDEFMRIREAILNVTDSPCFGSLFPSTACKVPLQSRSEFTPRYNPYESSIRSIVMEGVKVSEPKPNMYDPPDVRISVLDPPDGEIDVLRIIENGIDFAPNKGKKLIVEGEKDPLRSRRLRIKSKTSLRPGQGWGLDTPSAPDNCDGTWDSFCGRDASNDCLLSGHNDHRGGLLFDSYSGWLKLHLENVTYGLVFARIEDWTGDWMNPATTNFKCENNQTCETKTRNLEHEDHRLLAKNSCESFTFEFAIDGNITSWDKAAWDANRKQPQRVVHLWTFLDDPNYTKKKKNKNVELAIRLQGCDRRSTFSLTHVYWA